MTSANITAGTIRQVGLATELRPHPDIARAWFYTLPVALVDILQNMLQEPVDAEPMRLERTLAGAAEPIPGCVGFRDGAPIIDGILRPVANIAAADPVLDEYLRECQEAGFRNDRFRALLAQRTQSLSLPRQAYLGWLWTNSIFCCEFQQLVEHHPTLFADGQAPPQPVAEASTMPRIRSATDGSEQAAVVALQEFCRRWRLQQIIGPATVEPLGIHVPTPLPHLHALHAQTSGTLVYVPDTAPLPDREELRQFLEDNARYSAQNAEHLREWIELIRSDTRGKRSIEKFARWYPVQHYYRVIFQRHPNVFAGSRQRLAVGLGEYLQRSPATIERDLREISKRIGRNWHQVAPGMIVAP